jgi:hypothetical protein
VIWNAAEGRPATESSTEVSSNPASVAVDGNLDTDWFNGSCTLTATGDTTPWWRVDLQRIVGIITVMMLNRGPDTSGIGTSLTSLEIVAIAMQLIYNVCLASLLYDN